MVNNVKLTIIDDDEDDFILTEDLLSDIEGFQFEVDWVNDFELAENLLTKSESDIYLIDYRLGKLSGLDLLIHARKTGCKKPIIILTGQGDREIDMQAMKNGADDYLVKSAIDVEKLERSIRYALERYHTLEKLNHSEVKYKSLFQRSIDPIYIVDKNLNFIEVNQALTTLFGYQKDDVTTHDLSFLFEKEKTYERFKTSLLNKGLIKDFEVTLLRSDGKQLNCSITTIVLFDINNEVEGYQGIIRDNTKQKENEQQLLRAEKLGMTGRLARSIAHEVRNPLTNINLSLEQLMAEFQDNEDALMYSEIIKRNSDRINNLITELLNSAKPTSVVMDSIEIDDLIPKVIELAADRIKLQKISLKTELNCNKITANIDEEQMKIALLNIIINAIEAMPPDRQGELTISTCMENNQISISIADNGEGIEKDKLNNLFDAFYTGKRTGMGLGLTTTQNIINAHEAKIVVESEKGVGTKFTILIKPN
ncbi:PAS domain S-box protein [bacterium]|nr:PAS domain S-box protein [bacterium]